MFKNFLSVGGLTLLSRITGFVRDIILAAVIGGGAMMDVFSVAFRLPNFFRAIFGEGAFNAAFTPTYTQVAETQGRYAARMFSNSLYTLLLISQIAFSIGAIVFAAQFVDLFAPGYRKDPEKFALAVALARITFPYLLFISLLILQTAILNANGSFVAGSFAPVLLNLTMIASLAFVRFFPNADYAAAWGVTLSGVLQFLLVEYQAERLGVRARVMRPRWNADVKAFFLKLGPAVIGSAGFQIAVLADTIISSCLPTGSQSSIYYADRLYQLPIGVIGIAAGVVLLPEMSRALAAGREQQARSAQNRTVALTLFLSTPFAVIFTQIPTLILQAAFVRGNYGVGEANAAGAVLSAYAAGLMAIVLVSSARATFQARNDTTTPMYASLIAVGINVLLKIILYKYTTLGAVGLAVATSIGQWVNLAILVGMAEYAGLVEATPFLTKTAIACCAAAFALALSIALLFHPTHALAQGLGSAAAIVQLAELGAIGVIAYFGAFFCAARVVKLDISALLGASRLWRKLGFIQT